MIDQFAKDLFNNLQTQAQGIKELTESQLRNVVDSSVRKLDLVSREEFEAQQAVLLRTREKLEVLEKKFEEMTNADAPSD